MKTVFRTIVLISTLATSAAVFSEPGEFYLVPGVQWMDFDEEAGLDNDWGFSAGLGFQMTERLRAELSTFDLDPDSGAGDVDLDHYRLDMLYDVGRSLGNWQPFVLGGLGNTEFGNDNDSMMNLGAGLRLKISDRIEWRTAVRHFSYLGRDFEDADLGIDTGLLIYLGSRDRAPSRSTAAARPSTPVDERGCPIPVEEVARVELLVNFEFDRSEVRPQYFDEIEEVANFMAQYPDVVVELEGHTDSTGTDEYNQGLSERRANAVRDVMINRFNVRASRITARGFGESQPATSNSTSEGRAQNRRVITVIIKTLQNYQPR